MHKTKEGRKQHGRKQQHDAKAGQNDHSPSRPSPRHRCVGRGERMHFSNWQIETPRRPALRGESVLNTLWVPARGHRIIRAFRIGISFERALTSDGGGVTSLVILCVSAAERQTVSFGRSEKPPPPPAARFSAAWRAIALATDPPPNTTLSFLSLALAPCHCLDFGLRSRTHWQAHTQSMDTSGVPCVLNKNKLSPPKAENPTRNEACHAPIPQTKAFNKNAPPPGRLRHANGTEPLGRDPNPKRNITRDKPVQRTGATPGLFC